MTRPIESLDEIAAHYDAIVFDQWGVLHNGAEPYPQAIAAITGLKTPAAVLSNSGKRGHDNAVRISGMGFPEGAFETVMTSGEALWRDIQKGVIQERRFFAVERGAGDAATWSERLGVDLVTDLADAQAILLMGIPDGETLAQWDPQLQTWQAAGLALYCSNPDRKSPRPGGLVMSPGALAFRYRDLGGRVTFYGKPHAPVFRAVMEALGPGRFLMVGDSLEHDIAGAQAVGWDQLLIQGGLYAADFIEEDAERALARLTAQAAVAPPTYRMATLR